MDSSPLVRVHAVRTSAYPGNKVAAFDATSVDTARIAKLYALIAALKPFPQGIYNCPADLGVEYHLTFTRADGTIVAAQAAPDGCAWAGLTNADTGRTPHDQIADWDNFWPLFADTFGVPMSALDFTTPSPNGPYAPVNVP